MSTTVTTPPKPIKVAAPRWDSEARWLAGGAAVCLGLLWLVVGALFVGIDQTQRDAHGFLMNPTSDLRSAGAALVADEPQAGGDSGLHYDVTGDAQITVRSTRDVFVGIASPSAAERYLRGVAVRRIDDLADTGGTPARGGAAAARPADQPIWVASASGLGEQRLRWTASDGDQHVVVMNADGSRGVPATIAVGARNPSYISLGLGLGLLGVGTAMVVGGLLIMPLRRVRGR